MIASVSCVSRYIGSLVVAESTRNMTRYRLNLFFRVLTGVDRPATTIPTDEVLACLGADHLRTFVNACRCPGADRGKPYEDYTIRRTLDAVKEFCDHLHKTGQLDSIPEFPCVKLPPPKPRMTDIEIVGRLIRFGLTATITKQPELLADFYCLVYCTGLRISDILALTSDNLRSGRVCVDASKTKKEQVIPLPAWCLRRFEHRKGRLIPISYGRLIKVIRAACNTLGIDRITPKRMRSTSAFYWNKAGGHSGHVILGHALPGSSKATPHYLDAQQTLEDHVHNLLCPCDELLTPEERDESQKLDMRLLLLIKQMRPDRKRTLAEVAQGLSR